MVDGSSPWTTAWMLSSTPGRPNGVRWGRYLHLAENPAEPERPFAFLSTYAGLQHRRLPEAQPLRNALEQFAGENKRSALLKLLTPVEQAAKACPWVREMLDSRGHLHAAPGPPQRPTASC